MAGLETEAGRGDRDVLDGGGLPYQDFSGGGGGQYLVGGGDDADQDLVVFLERVDKLTVSLVFTVGKVV